MGQEALREFGDGYARHGKIALFAAHFDVTPDILRKARAFARAFPDPEDLDAVLNSAGQPVSWAHVRLLVSIKSRAARMQLVREILKNGWTARELAAEIVRRKPAGAPRRRGRQRKIAGAPPVEQKRMLIAASREFLATLAPNDQERTQLVDEERDELEQLLEAVIKRSRRTIRRFRGVA